MRGGRRRRGRRRARRAPEPAAADPGRRAAVRRPGPARPPALRAPARRAATPAPARRSVRTAARSPRSAGWRRPASTSPGCRSRRRRRARPRSRACGCGSPMPRGSARRAWPSARSAASSAASPGGRASIRARRTPAAWPTAGARSARPRAWRRPSATAVRCVPTRARARHRPRRAAPHRRRLGVGVGSFARPRRQRDDGLVLARRGRRRRPVHRVGGEGRRSGFRGGLGGGLRHHGGRDQDRRRFLGHQLVVVLVLFVVTERFVRLGGARRYQNGGGVRRRGAARRAGERGRLGLQEGGGFDCGRNGSCGDDRHRRRRLLRAQDAFEGARTGQAQRRAGQRGRATALAGTHGEHDGRGVHGVRRIGQLAAAGRAEVGAFDDGGLAVVAIHACVLRPLVAGVHTSRRPPGGRKLFATCPEKGQTDGTAPGRAAGPRRAVRHRADVARSRRRRGPREVTIFVSPWPRNDAGPNGVSADRLPPRG